MLLYNILLCEGVTKVQPIAISPDQEAVSTVSGSSSRVSSARSLVSSGMTMMMIMMMMMMMVKMMMMMLFPLGTWPGKNAG